MLFPSDSQLLAADNLSDRVSTTWQDDVNKSCVSWAPKNF